MSRPATEALETYLTKEEQQQQDPAPHSRKRSLMKVTCPSSSTCFETTSLLQAMMQEDEFVSFPYAVGWPGTTTVTTAQTATTIDNDLPTKTPAPCSSSSSSSAGSPDPIQTTQKLFSKRSKSSLSKKQHKRKGSLTACRRRFSLPSESSPATPLSSSGTLDGMKVWFY
uniref:Uncharacterized protein n=1 Tax=Amphora coffeiformis TaxID=265554 RepID=A0A7S3L6C8_9STRA|mmetsp:Transcript_19335/g.36490  ORF Transcript_19335/g.36490 Transcript_19335/m.36490 type:complete len:169 (+) Transcript_19335:264-770(+)|eukprot:scaffold4964_cov166-Amphora_coffeaeformis.AAC.7